MVWGGTCCVYACHSSRQLLRVPGWWPLAGVGGQQSLAQDGALYKAAREFPVRAREALCEGVSEGG